MRNFTTALLFSVFLVSFTHADAEPVRLEQIVSREHPSFNAGPARLVVGRDGMIYLCNTVIGDSFVMRLAPDGTQKIGAKVESAAENATANKDGVIVSSHNGPGGQSPSNHVETNPAQDSFRQNPVFVWYGPGSSNYSGDNVAVYVGGNLSWGNRSYPHYTKHPRLGRSLVFPVQPDAPRHRTSISLV